MTKSPDWPAVYDLMKAGNKRTPWSRVCAGMTELDGERGINRAKGEEGRGWVHKCVHWCLKECECKQPCRDKTG